MKISIITCTYNSEVYLENNIESITNQTYQNFEHIFVDGFSTDKTIELIKKYQEKYPEKVFLIQSEPKGISNAMNIGIQKATGEYIIHLHSDDSLYNQNVLEETIAFLKENNSPDWIYGKINVLEKNNSKGVFPIRKIWHKQQKNSFKKYLLKYFNYVPHQAVFIKKEIFDTFEYFDQTLKTAMDFEFWLRIKDKTNWIFFDKIISNYSLRSDAQSSAKKNKLQNQKEILSVQKKYLNIFEFLFLFFFKILINFKRSNYQKN